MMMNNDIGKSGRQQGHIFVQICGIIAFVLINTIANAQEQQNKTVPIEEIVITGVKDSLVSAQEVKRSADGIVDAILFEDIGKYTDDNLAETLQRVPGLQIRRSENGEGQFVSIRGLGPAFVRSTVNGRSAFGGTGGDNGLGNQRAFGLDAVPPELVAAVIVAKTPGADMIEGGLAGVVDIRTARPLDLNVADDLYDDGIYVKASVDFVYNDSNENTDPRWSVFGSWTPNEKFGLLANLTGFERETLTQISRDRGDSLVNVNGQNVFAPLGGIQYSLNDGTLERNGYAVTAQWRPTDDFDIVLDFLKNTWLTERNQNVILTSLGNATIQNPVIASSDVPGLDGFLVGADFIGDPNIGQISPNYTVFDREETFWGLNIEWRPNEGPLAVKFDVAKIESDYDRNEDLLEGVPILGVNGLRYNGDGDALLFELLDDGGNPVDVLSAQFGPIGTVGFNRFDFRTEEESYKIDFEFDLENKFLSSLEWGVSYRKRTSDQIFNVFRYGLADQALILAEAGLTTADIPSFTTFNAPKPDGGFLNELDGVSYSTWNGFAATEAFEFWRPLIDSFSGTPAGGIDARAPLTETGPGLISFLSSVLGYEAREDLLAAYGTVNFETQIGSVPVSGNVGVRVVDAQTEGIGFRAGELESRTGGGTDVLPSLNLALDLRDDLILRFGASRSVARPEPSELAGETVVNVARDPITQEPTSVSVTRKNPGLQPYMSNNFDIIAEWYPGDEGAFFAVGYFLKDISDFVSTDTSFPDSIAAEGQTISSADAQITVTEPVNSGDAKVSGVELQGHLPFSWLTAAPIISNTGIQFTYTKLIESETPATDPITGAALEFPGASEDNYSFVGYYDNGRFSSRVSYTFRGRNFIGIDFFGAAAFEEEYEALDFTVDYKFNENWSVRGQARNLLEEPIGRTVGGGALPSFYSQNGRSFGIGVRANY